MKEEIEEELKQLKIKLKILELEEKLPLLHGSDYWETDNRIEQLKHELINRRISNERWKNMEM